MKVGFIGTGSMGSILIESFIQSKALKPLQIKAHNRTRAKAQRLADKYPGVEVAGSSLEIALDCQVIFLCVKPFEYIHVIKEIQRVIEPSQMIVSITSPVLIAHLEEQLSCKIAKVIPSITNYVMSGASLCMYSERMKTEDIIWLETLLGYISTPIQVAEQYTRVCSDLSSCGPAFLAFYIERFIQAAVEEAGIPQEEATRLASEMVLGTGKLLTEGGFTPSGLQERVSVPGGITAEGIKMMSEEFQGTFNRLIQITHAKYDEDLKKLNTDMARVDS